MTNRNTTFHILLAAQFALIAVSMLVNVKTGLFSMVLILLLTTVCLIQLSNGKSTEWERGQNIMTWLFIVWLLYYIMEIMNPNCVLEAWNINITPYALIPLICAFVVPVVIRTKKDIELLLLVWSAFVIIFTQSHAALPKFVLDKLARQQIVLRGLELLWRYDFHQQTGAFSLVRQLCV